MRNSITRLISVAAACLLLVATSALAETVFSIGNTTIGATRTITMSDADTQRLAAALNAVRYDNQYTARQAIEQWLRDVIGDAKALIHSYEKSIAVSPPISTTE